MESSVKIVFEPTKGFMVEENGVLYHKTVEELHTDGQLFEVTHIAKACGYKTRCFITNGLFKAIYPVAQDAAKRIDFASRIEDMLSGFKKICKGKKDRFMAFGLSVPTVVTEYKNHEQIMTRQTVRDVKLKIFAFLERESRLTKGSCVQEDGHEYYLIFGRLR